MLDSEQIKIFTHSHTTHIYQLIVFFFKLKSCISKSPILETAVHQIAIKLASFGKHCMCKCNRIMQTAKTSNVFISCYVVHWKSKYSRYQYKSMMKVLLINYTKPVAPCRRFTKPTSTTFYCYQSMLLIGYAHAILTSDFFISTSFYLLFFFTIHR